MTDPIAEFVRAERAALIERAPRHNAAQVWHAARRRRAAALQRTAMLAGWGGRAVVGAAAAYGLYAWRSEAWFLLFLLVLFTWLTRGACALPARLARGVNR